MAKNKACEHRSTRTIQRSENGQVVSEWITCNDCGTTVLQRDLS